MASNQSTWDGLSSQSELMQKDQVILVDEDDVIIGSASKWDSHRFVPGQPRGMLHRAFSVFLFNKEGKLLLQKRAADKITFPNVWTNTCCSHPLTGFELSEVDQPPDVANGSAMGVKRAAVRKLEQELGIQASSVPLTKFKFLTRLHYYAADSVTHGKHSPWGEHEIDYILFIQLDKEPAITPNPEEVDGTCWVSASELKAMMKQPDLLWSPWFRIIADRWLIPEWWSNLKATITTDKYVDVAGIHRFDPPSIHRSGAGVCGLAAADGGSAKKQGAYGKIRTIEPSKFMQLLRIDEVILMVAYKFGFGAAASNVDYAGSADREFCDKMLGKVSRSFAAVIRQLPKQLAMDVVVYYLALRGLDTVEDDMTVFDDNADKIHCLRRFHETVLIGQGSKLGTKGGKEGRPSIDKFIGDNGLVGIGEADERRLLEQFDCVARVFNAMPDHSKEVIGDVTRQMGAGMAEFVEKDLGQGTATVKEYNLYCHYVAGLVGHGLSRLFAATQVESATVAENLDLANSMGLFLQKTNIIRDYLEDYVDGRAFWPAEVWRKHATRTGQLGELALPHRRGAARACLNELVTDALELVPECFAYMKQLKNVQVFSFCAVPQVMAIATLAEVYDNGSLFEGVVKIRKGLAVKLIMSCSTMEGLAGGFDKALASIATRVPDGDPSAARTLAACKKGRAIAQRHLSSSSTLGPFSATITLVAVVAAIWRLLNTVESKKNIDQTDVLAVFLIFTGAWRFWRSGGHTGAKLKAA